MKSKDEDIFAADSLEGLFAAALRAKDIDPTLESFVARASVKGKCVVADHDVVIEFKHYLETSELVETACAEIYKKLKVVAAFSGPLLDEAVKMQEHILSGRIKICDLSADGKPSDE